MLLKYQQSPLLTLKLQKTVMRMTEKGRRYSLTTGDFSLSIFGQPFPFSSHQIIRTQQARNKNHNIILIVIISFLLCGTPLIMYVYDSFFEILTQLSLSQYILRWISVWNIMKRAAPSQAKRSRISTTDQMMTWAMRYTMYILSTFFRQIKSFIRFHLAFVFGL